MPKSKTSLNELLFDLRRITDHRTVLTEKKIRKIYKSLVKDLNDFLAQYYAKYADDKGNLTITKLQEKMKYAKFLEEIENNVNFFAPKIKREIEGLIDKTYKACYEGMYSSVKEAKNTKELIEASGISVRPEVVEQAVNNNISKLTLSDLLEKNRKEIVYDIKQTLTTGMILGERYDTMAKKILEKVDFSYGKAIRVARTESHRNVEAGFMDSANEINKGLEDSNLIYIKIYRNVGDERVRPQQMYKTKKGWKTKMSRNGANHMNVDGQVRKITEPFEYSDGEKAMYPGSIELPARHACNCRCFCEYDLITKEEYEKIKKNGGKIL